MEQLSHLSYVDLIIVACGFLIVFLTKYGFSDSEKKATFEPLGRRKYSVNSPNRLNPTAASRRTSFSRSPSGGHAKRKGRRTFGIKHL